MYSVVNRLCYCTCSCHVVFCAAASGGNSAPVKELPLGQNSAVAQPDAAAAPGNKDFNTLYLWVASRAGVSFFDQLCTFKFPLSHLWSVFTSVSECYLEVYCKRWLTICLQRLNLKTEQNEWKWIQTLDSSHEHDMSSRVKVKEKTSWKTKTRKPTY